MSPSFSELVATFARIGCLSFGGPAGQIALMHRVLVEEKRWIDEARFLHALNVCMLLPGPEAMQLATYVGWLLHGTRGGLAAGLLFIGPGLAVLLALSTLYVLLGALPAVAGLFFGLKAAVLVLVVEALIRVGRRALKRPLHWGLAAAAFVALFGVHLPFPVVVIAAGLIGWAGSLLAPSLFITAPKTQSVAALPDPATGVGATIRTFLLWGAVWAVPAGAAALLLGRDSVYPELALFFSKMAVVTFGGAYAVLAYVAEAAVATLGWLKPGEMVDGLALAETTPGPLILVLTFVGFLAAHRTSGVLPPLGGGFAGALLTTWVTFAPSFLMVFLAAPHTERLRHNRPLGGALSAITAAVVGVILNLTLWFGLHVLFARVETLDLGVLSPSVPVWSSLDPAALALFLVAAVALFRFHLGLPAVLALAGVLGLVARMLA